jgi:hypothetical protein
LQNLLFVLVKALIIESLSSTFMLRSGVTVPPSQVRGVGAMPKARIDRAPVPLRAAVNWILFDDFDRPPEILVADHSQVHWNPATTYWCPSAEELKAQESLLVAIRDDELCASGRFSNNRAAPWEAPQFGRAWVMHSRSHTKIACDRWQEGTYNWVNDTLDVCDGQYIGIQVPRFMVEAIWPPDPKAPLQVGIGDNADPPPVYTTPYLDAMQQAIAALGISANNQPKKETVMAWFRERKLDELQLSENHIRHLATFVRLPQSQKGGNRKWRAT